jgi:arylsulfatase A-like enzyme
MQAPAALIKKYELKQKLLGIQNKDRFAKDEEWMKYESGWRRRLVQDNPIYAAMIENMDGNIGRLLEKLKQTNLGENTLVIFTSDNGGLSTAEGSPTVNGPLRGGKGWLYEGGIRVPLIMYWKGKVIAGSTSGIPISTSDFYPTIANVINDKYEKQKSIDGDNIFELLAQSQRPVARQLFWHYPHYSNQGGKPGSAIRDGDYKLVYNYEDKSVELYNLVNDIAEKNNLALMNKKIVKRLKKELFNWLKVNAALLPNKNPDYNPSAVSPISKTDE